MNDNQFIELVDAMRKNNDGLQKMNLLLLELVCHIREIVREIKTNE